MKFANQKEITVNKQLVKKEEKGRRYMSCYVDLFEESSKNIKGEIAYKLYIYFLSYSSGYSIDFSPAYFAEKFGCSVSAARKAVTTLEEAGYLVRETNYKYAFYDVPQEIAKEEKIDIDFGNEEKRKCRMSDGTYKNLTYREVYAMYCDTAPETMIKEWWDKQGGAF